MQRNSTSITKTEVELASLHIEQYKKLFNSSIKCMEFKLEILNAFFHECNARLIEKIANNMTEIEILRGNKVFT